MPTIGARLSAKATAILEQIAAGRTYEQILQRYPVLAYADIFDAAREVLALDAAAVTPVAKAEPQPAAPAPRPPKTGAAHLADVREQYRRAYERWTRQEDEALTRAARANVPVEQIAEGFQRQPSAIRSRLELLGLTGQHPATVLPDPPQAARGEPASGRYPRTNDPWTKLDDAQLLALARHGLTVPRIATRLQRDRDCIRQRLKALNVPFNS